MIGQSVDNNNIQIKVLGFGQHISMGLNKGEVIDLHKLSNAISKAVEKAEEMAGFRISNITCNITGGLPFTKITSDNIQITDNLIKKEDVLKLLNLEKYKSKYENYIQIRRKPKDFKIDNDQEVDNPIGLKSKTLTLGAINTYVNKNVISNLNKSIELCHLTVNQFYITPEINGISTMIKEERDLGAIIIDIGANIGSVSLIIAKKFKNSRVFAIEPTNYAFQKLSKNLDLNDDLKDKVFLKQLFISDNKKPQKVWSSWNFEKSDNKHQKHMGTLKEIKENSYIGLEKFIEIEKLKNVDFIKLDVDGYELDVLKSGETFLAKTKPIIFIEIAPYLYPEFGYSCEELVKFIISLNYSFHDENLIKIEDIFSVINNIKDGSSRNFFLI